MRRCNVDKAAISYEMFCLCRANTIYIMSEQKMYVCKDISREISCVAVRSREYHLASCRR